MIRRIAEGAIIASRGSAGGVAGVIGIGRECCFVFRGRRDSMFEVIQPQSGATRFAVIVIKRIGGVLKWRFGYLRRCRRLRRSHCISQKRVIIRAFVLNGGPSHARRVYGRCRSGILPPGLAVLRRGAARWKWGRGWFRRRCCVGDRRKRQLRESG